MLNKPLLIIPLIALAALAAPGCGTKEAPPAPVSNTPADNIKRINTDQSLTPEQRQAALDAQSKSGDSAAAAK